MTKMSILLDMVLSNTGSTIDYIVGELLKKGS